MAMMTYTPYGTLRGAGAVAYGAYSAYPRKQSQVYTGWNSTVRLRSKRRRYGGTRSGFKTKMLANTPAKHATTDDNQTAVVGGTHNTMYTCNITAGVAAGTADDSRVGDTIQVAAIKLNGLLSTNPLSTASCQYRIIVGWSGEEYNLPNTLSAAGLTAAEVFETGTGGVWRNTGIINPKAFTVLDDRIYTLNNSISMVSDIQEFAYTVPCSTSFPYQANGSVFGKTRNLYVVFIPCILNGTTGATIAGSIALSTDLIFKQV